MEFVVINLTIIIDNIQYYGWYLRIWNRLNATSEISYLYFIHKYIY